MLCTVQPSHTQALDIPPYGAWLKDRRRTVSENVNKLHDVVRITRKNRED